MDASGPIGQWFYYDLRLTEETEAQSGTLPLAKTELESEPR